MEKAVQYAKNDGRVFAEYCRKTLGLPEKNIHYVTDATLNNLKYELKWLQNVMKVYRGEAKVISIMLDMVFLMNRIKWVFVTNRWLWFRCNNRLCLG